jgi:Mn2+/Fe2+ NRAMP family transporter
LRGRWAQVLFWSVISAAFIGPGTVTTCAKAGASFGTALIWALVFSTFACVVLQEAATRLTIATGSDLGRALRERFKGATGFAVIVLVLGAIVVGCAAYQAGNILGAVAGAQLLQPGPNVAWVAAIGLPAALLLAFAATGTVVRVLGYIVALMGLVFVATAAGMLPDSGELARGALIPSIPDGSALLVLGMIGTTVVPYNLFLASGLARGRNADNMRFGLVVAIVLGGAISIAVLLVGSGLSGEFSFEELAASLAVRLGGWAYSGFGLGLAAAGFTSALTAPLAAALTARGLFSHDGSARWSERSWRYRAVWAFVLLAGLGFAASGTPPIPAIIAAQALNGAILPIVAIFLFVVVNDRSRMGAHANGLIANAALYLCVAVSLVLGVSGVLRAAARAFEAPAPSAWTILLLAGVLLAVVSLPMWRTIRRA